MNFKEFGNIVATLIEMKDNEDYLREIKLFLFTDNSITDREVFKEKLTSRK